MGVARYVLINAALAFPVKESGLILLQTIPDDINIDSLRVQLLQAFPDIVNVHDLHVWQFTADKIFSTAHIIFLNPAVSIFKLPFETSPKTMLSKKKKNHRQFTQTLNCLKYLNQKLNRQPRKRIV